MVTAARRGRIEETAVGMAEDLAELLGEDIEEAARGMGFLPVEARVHGGLVELEFTVGGRAVTVWMRSDERGGPRYTATGRFDIGYRTDGDAPGVTDLVEEVARRVRERERDWNPPVERRGGEGLKLLGDRLELRVTTGCNESCPFCNTDDGVENLVTGDADVAAAIEDAAAMGARRVVFTGGEPTLRRELPAWIALAKAKGLATWVQTNGLVPARAGFWKRLEAAGALPEFIHVSFHTAKSDRIGPITGRPGTLDDKISAVRASMDRGIKVYLCMVITTLNQDEVSDFPGFVADTFGTEPVLQFSVMAPTGRALHALHLMPRYSEVGPAVASALDSARSLGLAAYVLEACGIPMCFLPDHVGFYDTISRLADGHARTMPDKTWTRACGECRLRPMCLGVWRRYLEIHGEEEFEPVRG